MKLELFPRFNSVPYYIFAPSYVHTSSGIRALHLLCHHLNAVGQRAFWVPLDNVPYPNPELLLSPVLTQVVINEYARQGIEPIVVYPDTVKGNPINAKKVVRYLLAPAGMFGGETEFSRKEQVWLYKGSCDNGINVPIQGLLSVPASDPKIYYPPPKGMPRSGSCFYSKKYDQVFGNPLLDITKNSKRLWGSFEQLAEVLRQSEVCYLYELTATITEGPLCGCPIVLIRTNFLNKLGPGDFLAGNIRWDDGEIIAQDTEDEIHAKYQQFMDAFPGQLENFIQKTQNWAI